MLDIGWWELMVIAVLAILVVGPKDLPRMMRTIGQFVSKARGMAAEFQKGMSDLADQADLKELKDIQKDINTIRNPVGALKDEVKKELDFSLDKDFSKPVQDGPRDEEGDAGSSAVSPAAPELDNPVGPPMSSGMRKDFAQDPAADSAKVKEA